MFYATQLWKHCMYHVIPSMLHNDLNCVTLEIIWPTRCFEKILPSNIYIEGQIGNYKNSQSLINLVVCFMPHNSRSIVCIIWFQVCCITIWIALLWKSFGVHVVLKRFFHLTFILKANLLNFLMDSMFDMEVNLMCKCTHSDRNR